MLSMICVDVDGTLIGTDNRVREDVWAALASARARGVRVVLCSGRPAFGNALEYARRLDPDGWHIFQNGASIVRVDQGVIRNCSDSRTSGKAPDALPSPQPRSFCPSLRSDDSEESSQLGISLSEPFPAEVLPDLIACARRTGWLLEVYTDTEYGFTHSGPYAEAHAALLGLPYVIRGPETLTGTVVRVQWVVARRDEAAVLAQPHPGLDVHPSLSPAMPGVSFVSATRAGTSKGSAVARVAAEYGLGLDRVMMVGDAENDVSALRVVGHPVAMGNADAAARAAARWHVGHVDAGGLIEATELALSL